MVVGPPALKLWRGGLLRRPMGNEREQLNRETWTRGWVAAGAVLGLGAFALVLWASLFVPSRANPIAEPSRLAGLTAFPAEITLLPKAREHRLLVTGVGRDGSEKDLTGVAVFSSDGPEVASVEAGGVVQGLRAGVTTIRARAGERAVSVRVRVEPGPAEPGLSFVNDILPVLSKAGCNAGGCHAKPEGQNGFKLSVFAYDPKADYAKIVKDDRGRRVFPARAEESLLLKKPTMAVEHGGGQRFERGSGEYTTILKWIQQGMPYAQAGEARLVDLKVYPAERRYEKGSAQHLLALADYSDGSARDVTRLAEFASNEKEIARVDDAGRVTVGNASGEGVVIARFMGLVAVSRVTVPPDKALPDSIYAGLPVNNEIDGLVYARLKKLGLAPSEGCMDGEFLRRASLDAIGTLPEPEEVRRFLAECESPAGTIAEAKEGRRQAARNAAIDRLLARPEYSDYWAEKWGDLIRPNPSRVGVKPVYLLDQWLRESFQENKPYNRFVRDLLTAEGSTHQYGPAALFRDKREPGDASAFVSQIFLGVRIECARCHHHPNEKWSQADFYQLAAYFGEVKRKGQGISAPISGLPEHIWFAPGGEVKNPVTGEVMEPKPLDGPAPKIDRQTDPRRALADWMDRPDNRFFARAIVNRVWASFLGRGIVDPVDDFRASNPPTNEPLLDWLAQDFTGHGYDLKHLMRVILRSRVYQLSSRPNEHNLEDMRNFSRSYRRRLSAETLLDAVSDVTGTPEEFEGLPPGARADETWNNTLHSEFLDAFGRPNPSAEAPCEREVKPSVVQALHLMNANAMQRKIAGSEGRARTLSDGKLGVEGIIDELYLRAYGRRPGAEELAIAKGAFREKGATRRTATEDLMWALLNSAEFVFNH
jgi:hypothetical protein